MRPGQPERQLPLSDIRWGELAKADQPDLIVDFVQSLARQLT